MEFYPAFLNLKNRKCLVIGGGSVAERKVLSLLGAGANVCVLSLQLTLNLKKLLGKDRITYVNSEYKAGALKGFFLVIAATNDLPVNSRIYKEAVKENILVNSVDSLSESNFIVPAVFNKGDLIVAVSSSGKAPCLAKRIKDDLKKIVDKEYSGYLKILTKVREKLKPEYSFRQRKRILAEFSRMPLSELKQNALVKEVLK